MQSVLRAGGRSASVIAICGLILSACVTSQGGWSLTNRQAIGAGTGAIAGAVIGSQVGKGKGRIVGAVAGTIIGAIAGYSIGSWLDQQELASLNARTADAARSAPLDQETTMSWSNSSNTKNGIVHLTSAGSPVDIARANNLEIDQAALAKLPPDTMCRAARADVENRVDQEKGTLQSIWCRDANGDWHAVASRPQGGVA